ncbi:Lrp/AsnC family transcriptional regulator [Hydrogenovibrio kuenenii]|uniref:Lrp/AsnC family transcriptional regulator n=1 Tax=Hydrogenovibrio kuenenii TaxID=63658 RepID=UPI000466819C|nr:Lrp/AsnC family transcriptional regulator [Hydrogenovibrio kuenenii]
MNKDNQIIELLVTDGRLSFADIAREIGVSRAFARQKVQKLLDDGIIEQFTAVINPFKYGKSLSAFLDVKVAPLAIEEIANQLASCPEVISLYIMSDMKSLHIHTLTDDQEGLTEFAHKWLFSREGILEVDCKTLLKRVKNRRGGPRL